MLQKSFILERDEGGVETICPREEDEVAMSGRGITTPQDLSYPPGELLATLSWGGQRAHSSRHVLARLTPLPFIPQIQ